MASITEAELDFFRVTIYRALCPHCNRRLSTPLKPDGLIFCNAECRKACPDEKIQDVYLLFWDESTQTFVEKRVWDEHWEEHKLATESLLEYEKKRWGWYLTEGIDPHSVLSRKPDGGSDSSELEKIEPTSSDSHIFICRKY